MLALGQDFICDVRIKNRRSAVEKFLMIYVILSRLYELRLSGKNAQIFDNTIAQRVLSITLQIYCYFSFNFYFLYFLLRACNFI